MAGLTTEQRAQREAEKLAAQNGTEQTPAQQDQQDQQDQHDQQDHQDQQDQQGVELVVMVRDAPEFPGGPLSADVHPDEVDNWLTLDRRLEEYPCWLRIPIRRALTPTPALWTCARSRRGAGIPFLPMMASAARC